MVNFMYQLGYDAQSQLFGQILVCTWPWGYFVDVINIHNQLGLPWWSSASLVDSVLPLQGAWVPSLVRKLRSLKLCGLAKTKTKTKHIYNQLTVRQIALHNVGGPHPICWRHKEQNLRFPREEGILPQDLDIEILPGFPAYWPAPQISDSRLHHQLSPEFITCWPALQISNMPASTITWAKSSK